MSRGLRVSLALAGALVAVGGALLVAAATIVVARALAGAGYPLAARWLARGVLGAFVAGSAGIVLIYLLRPRALVPPPVTAGWRVKERYRTRLKARLARSPLLAGRTLDTREELEAALGVLDAQADAVIVDAAHRVFRATALAEKGGLELLLLLWTQWRVVARVAAVYYGRPRPGELWYVLRGALSGGFLASEVVKLELSHDVQTVLAGTIESLASVVPGLAGMGTLASNALLRGGANAAVVVRTGLAAREYCAAPRRPDPAEVRRRTEQRVGGIVQQVTLEIAGSLAERVARGPGRAAAGAAAGLGNVMRNTGAVLLEVLRSVPSTGR